MSMICVPVRGDTIDELKVKVNRAALSADIIEIWMDGLPESVSAESVRKLTRKPIIAVCKGKKEKGSWNGSEEKRIERLLECAAAGMDYVDVDLRTRRGLISRLVAQTRGRSPRRAKLIVSYHDFKKTPSLKTLKSLYSRAVAAGADVVKIAVFANTYEDNLKLLGLGAAVGAGKRRRHLIITSMGEKGRIGRIAAPLFGSIIVFAALDKKSLTAPGQLTIKQYKKIASVIDTD